MIPTEEGSEGKQHLHMPQIDQLDYNTNSQNFSKFNSTVTGSRSGQRSRASNLGTNI